MGLALLESSGRFETAGAIRTKYARAPGRSAGAIIPAEVGPAPGPAAIVHSRAPSSPGHPVPRASVAGHRRASPSPTAALLRRSAQQGDPSLLTVQRIYGSPRVRRRAVRARPLAGRRHRLHHAGAVGGRDGAGPGPVRRGEGDAREVMVAARQLVPPGRTSPLEVEDYGWSPDDKHAADLHQHPAGLAAQHPGRLLGASTGAPGKLRKLGGPDAKPSTLMFAKFSPDGRRVAYVRENNLYVEDLASGDDHPAHHRRLAHAHQRHLRLGLRRGVDELLRRRLALESGRAHHRLLAAQRRLGEELRSDQQHRLALLQGHPGAVPQGGRDQLRRAGRRRERVRRPHPLAGDPGRPPQPLHRPDGVGGELRRGGPPAPQPAAERRTRSCWAMPAPARCGRCSPSGTAPGWTWWTTSSGSTAARASPG